MGFNDWLSFDPAPMSAVDHGDEVDEVAGAALATQLQAALRSRVDPGISLKDAKRAQSIRVKSEGGGFTIDEDDQDAVLKSSAENEPKSDDDNEATSVDQLFEMGSGVPSAETGEDGVTRLSYRTISMENLFGTQQQGSQDDMVEQIVTDTLRTGVAEAYESATTDVTRRHPGT